MAQHASGRLSTVPALHVHHVSLRYGDTPILEDVSFDLAAGEFLAIVGPNGAGKSTLVKVVLGLKTPQKGHALIFGRPAGEQPKRTGYVPQLKTFDRTFPATAEELVVTGLRRSWPARPRADELERAAAARAGAGGAGSLARRPLAKLSGGELQRAYLARALVRRPELVLLDEPATGVDFLAGTTSTTCWSRTRPTAAPRGDGDPRPLRRPLPRQPGARPQPPRARLRRPRSGHV